MKMATIVGPLSRFDAVVRGCIVGREFHPESAMQVMRKVKGLYAFDQSNPFLELLRRAECIAAAAGIKLGYRPFDAEGYDPAEPARYFTSLENDVTALRAEREELVRRLSENEQVLLQLTHLVDVNVPLQEFFNCTYVKFRFGKMPRELFDNFFPLIKDRGDVYLFTTNVERDYVYAMYMTPRAGAERVDSLFASLQFDRIRLSDRLEGSGAEADAAIRRDIIGCNRRIEEIDRELSALTDRETDRFLSAYSFVRYSADAHAIRRYAAHTEESFYLLGWIPEEEFARFEADLAVFDEVSLVVVSEDPDTLTDYLPPTKLKNPRIFKPFEPFVAMYGLPGYNEIDPTPIMALTYPLMFGVMFGDIGHGALVFLIGLLMWYGKKMWLGKVICYCGVASVLFGFVFGSIFGNEHLLGGFKVLESSGTIHDILQTTMYGGAVLVALAILLNVWNGIRQRDAQKVFFGANSLAGLLVYVGVVFVVLPFLGFGTSPLPLPVLLCFIALPAVLIFLREPLSQLAAKKKVHLEDGAGGFIVSNFFELFEVLLSFVTNTISFLRVGAYAISHASMMTVVYTLAKGADGSHNLAVLIVGNLIVAGIEALLVGIQVLRLEFYEIFGRFYGGGGRPYEPLTIDYTHVKE